jgi:hypothetical protein
MRMRLLPFVVLLAVACAYPQTSVQTVDTRPGLAFHGAPASAVLIVDGRRIGDPNTYDGQPQYLMVEPGTHSVVIKADDGATIFQQLVYVESEHRTLEVH